MKFGLIKLPDVRIIDVPGLDAALILAGIPRWTSDLGTVQDGLAIAVWEWSLFAGGEINYFSIGKKLYGGNAVLFAYDKKTGRTVDLKGLPAVCFYRDMREVERAIAANQVARPQIGFEGEVFWRWPQPGGREAAERASQIAFERALKEGRAVTIDGDTTIMPMK